MATDFIRGHFWVLFPIMSYSFVGVCLSLAFLAIGFQLADTNTPLVTVIEANGDPCSSYTVSQFIHAFMNHDVNSNKIESLYISELWRLHV